MTAMSPQLATRLSTDLIDRGRSHTVGAMNTPWLAPLLALAVAVSLVASR